MLTVFQVCFFVGIGCTLISFFLGQFCGLFGIDGLDLDIDILGIDLFFPISPMLYLIFFTVFGGSGWILCNSGKPLALFFIFGISLFIGFSVSFILYFFVIKPLKRAQNTSAPESEELIGIQATVTESILKDGFGEISYTIYGNSYTAPAKTTDGEALKQGTTVAICWMEDHVFYVSGISI